MSKLFFFLSILVFSRAAPVVSPADFQWLNSTVRLFIEGCRLVGLDNVTLFTPDASSSYGAQWTRDFTMALMSAGPASFPLGVNVSASVAYTLDRITPVGIVPDRVQADGEAVFAPCTPGCWPISLAWDNMPYAALLLANYASLWQDSSFFCRYEKVVRRALFFVPLKQGLAFNDPQSPNTSFGFEDSVVVPGRQLTVSLLMHHAAQDMAALSHSTGCGDAESYSALASVIAGSVDSLYNNASGLFYASDSLELVDDIFGSAYLVTQNLSTPERRKGVANFLASQWEQAAAGAEDTIFQEGQVRHLPWGVFWKKCWKGCPAPGTYQNGAFWATPLNWVLGALDGTGFTATASAIANATINSFMEGGVMECINRPLNYHGVRDYVASATNLFGAISPAASMKDKK